MKFLGQGFQKLGHEHDRQTDTHATERIRLYKVLYNVNVPPVFCASYNLTCACLYLY